MMAGIWLGLIGAGLSGNARGPLFASLTTASSAHQIDRGAHFEQGIGGRFDSLNARDGIENDLPLFAGIVGDYASENDSAEIDKPPVLRPMSRCVVHSVRIAGH